MDFTALPVDSNGEVFAHHSANIWNKAGGTCVGGGEEKEKKLKICLEKKEHKKKCNIYLYVIKNTKRDKKEREKKKIEREK